MGRRRWRRGRHLFEAVCLLCHRRPAGRLGEEDQVLIVLAFYLFFGSAFCASRESWFIKISKNQIVLFLLFFCYSRSDLSRLAPALEDSAFSYGFHSEELVHLADYWLRE